MTAPATIAAYSMTNVNASEISLCHWKMKDTLTYCYGDVLQLSALASSPAINKEQQFVRLE